MQTETRRIRYFVGREQVDPAGRYLDATASLWLYTIGSELAWTKG
jgi:hypothetical protein